MAALASSFTFAPASALAGRNASSIRGKALSSALPRAASIPQQQPQRASASAGRAAGRAVGLAAAAAAATGGAAAERGVCGGGGGGGVSSRRQGRAERMVALGRKGTLGKIIGGDINDDAPKPVAEKEKKPKGMPKNMQGMQGKPGRPDAPVAAGSSAGDSKRVGNWLKVGSLTEDFKEKPIKLLELANGNFLLVKWEDNVFCTSLNSTAYQFPLIEGEVFFGAAGPAIRVPLDGTEYDLTTGEVLKWCPKDNPMRAMLGALKSNVDPVALPVYPCRVDADGSILTTFVKGETAASA